jgi:hypothetical protein
MATWLEYYGEDGTHYTLEAIEDGAELHIEQPPEVEAPARVLTQWMTRQTLEALLDMGREILGPAVAGQPSRCPHCGGAILVTIGSVNVAIARDEE